MSPKNKNYNGRELSNASSRYTNLESDRQPFLDRARECSKLTVPSLLPASGHTGTSRLPTPFQSIGARGVNHLASKLLTTIVPPNSPFFRLRINQEDLGEERRGEAEYVLSRIESRVMAEVEHKSIRVAVFEALKHLIVAGNVLLFVEPRSGVVRVFRLDRYVISRDPMGNVLTIITKETVSPHELDDKLIKHCFPDVKDVEEFRNSEQHKTIDVYTHVKRQGDKFVSVQAVNGFVVPNSKKTFNTDSSPWVALRYTRIDGESYGRGLIEEYFGDLKSAEALNRAIIQGSQAAAKVLMLVNPNGVTKLRDLQKAENGDFVYGSPDEVQALQLNKQGDFATAHNLLQVIEQRLSAAFLLSSSVQRQAERVTAAEVRFMAQELESALGGIYSLLSQEMQLPLVRILLNGLQAKGEIPTMPKGVVEPQITTGIEALGRATDLNKLAQFLEYLQPLGAEVIQQEVNLNDYIDRLGASIGIDMGGLIKTEEQKQQETAQKQQQLQQQQMATMAEKAAPALAGGMAKAMG